MEGQTLLFFKLALLIGRLSAEHCDRANTMRVREGNIGQSADFNWLGVLKVHLPEWDELHTAMSGIVLIKIKYALANADDVVRIPQNIFKTNSKAMFLAARNTPWFVKPASYVTHPEYDYSTLNSLAVVELNVNEVDDFPLTPICLPTADTFHASRYLYLTGFTDDNQMLEKVIYKIQYLDKKVCEEFYNRAVVPSEKLIPSAFQCGYAPNSKTQCIWENGMVLVSNEKGYYDLIGFGIHGPGCVAPARFIDLFPYFSWIKSVTSPDEVYHDAGYRRKDKFIPNIPIHELYTMKGSRRLLEFESYSLKSHFIKPDTDEKTLLIIPFKDTWQGYEDACSKPDFLMYKEHFEMYSEDRTAGSVTYKLSLFDLAYATCSCVRINVDRKSRSDAAILAFSLKEISHHEEKPDPNKHSSKTPEDILMDYPKIENPDEEVEHRKIMNHDLLITVHFTGKVILNFEMFAKSFNSSVGWVLPTTAKN